MPVCAADPSLVLLIQPQVGSVHSSIQMEGVEENIKVFDGTSTKGSLLARDRCVSFGLEPTNLPF